MRKRKVKGLWEKRYSGLIAAYGQQYGDAAELADTIAFEFGSRGGFRNKVLGVLFELPEIREHFPHFWERDFKACLDAMRDWNQSLFRQDYLQKQKAADPFFEWAYRLLEEIAAEDWETIQAVLNPICDELETQAVYRRYYGEEAWRYHCLARKGWRHSVAQKLAKESKETV